MAGTRGGPATPFRGSRARPEGTRPCNRREELTSQDPRRMSMSTRPAPLHLGVRAGFLFMPISCGKIQQALSRRPSAAEAVAAAGHDHHRSCPRRRLLAPDRLLPAECLLVSVSTIL